MNGISAFEQDLLVGAVLRAGYVANRWRILFAILGTWTVARNGMDVRTKRCCYHDCFIFDDNEMRLAVIDNDFGSLHRGILVAVSLSGIGRTSYPHGATACRSRIGTSVANGGTVSLC